MRHSKIEIYIHFVGTTKNRVPLLESPDVERRVYRIVESKAQELKCSVLAIGGMSDHVHLLLKIPATICVSEIARKLKGESSSAARHFAVDYSFDWQDGYGAFSVSKSHLTKVTNYVLNQPQYHATGDLWPALEQTDEQL